MLGKDSAISAVNELDKDNFENVSKGFGALALLPDAVEKLNIPFHEAIGRISLRLRHVLRLCLCYAASI